MLRSDAVSSTIVHPCGRVIASCSGQRHFEVDQYDSSDSNEHTGVDSAMVSMVTRDSTLKVWSV
jgi:telomerase Cajal body protein 1